VAYQEVAVVVHCSGEGLFLLKWNWYWTLKWIWH